MTTLSQNPDVIVIGAGTAGLSAAKTLRAAGIDTVVLEAADHVGGRCVTDHDTFGLPFDRGGSWLHSAPINPLVPIAEDHGLTLHKKPAIRSTVQTGGQLLSAEEVTRYQTYQEDMWDIVSDRGAVQPDTTVADAMPPCPWTQAQHCTVAQMLGGDADVTSAEDSYNYAEAEGDWLIENGLGSFIQMVHCDVPVTLKCPVEQIDYAGSGVAVTTPNGTLHAKHVVLSVSTGVLAAETIKFIPPLPTAKRDAVEMLPNGLLNKIGLRFDPSWDEAKEAEIVDFHERGEAFCSIQFRFFDTPLAVGFTAGRFAAALEREGPGATTDYCLHALRSIFGNDVTKYIQHTDETAWNSNPLTFGSYSYAKPGGAGARATLAQPIANRIFFAGEAVMRDTYSTVHGAYLSGINAAEQIITTMRPQTSLAS